jgi:hypothetical protein
MQRRTSRGPPTDSLELYHTASEALVDALDAARYLGNTCENGLNQLAARSPPGRFPGAGGPPLMISSTRSADSRSFILTSQAQIYLAYVSVTGMFSKASSGQPRPSGHPGWQTESSSGRTKISEGAYLLRDGKEPDRFRLVVA